MVETYGRKGGVGIGAEAEVFDGGGEGTRRGLNSGGGHRKFVGERDCVEGS